MYSARARTHLKMFFHTKMSCVTRDLIVHMRRKISNRCGIFVAYAIAVADCSLSVVSLVTSQ